MSDTPNPTPLPPPAPVQASRSAQVVALLFVGITTLIGATALGYRAVVTGEDISLNVIGNVTFAGLGFLGGALGLGQQTVKRG